MRLVKRLTIGLAIVVAIVVVLGWLVVSSPILAVPRGAFVAGLVEKQTGQPIQIDGGVGIGFGPELSIWAEDILLPSPSEDSVTLASVGSVAFQLNLRDILNRKVTISEVQVGETSLALLVDKDGKSSWQGEPSDGSKGDLSRTLGMLDKPGLLRSVLSDGQAQFSSLEVTYKDARNGFEFDLSQDQLSLTQDTGDAPIVLTGTGTLNGQPLQLDATLPPGQPFTFDATAEHVTLKANGTPIDTSYANGFSTELAADVAELGQLLDLLKLQRLRSGVGKVSAQFVLQPDGQSLHDLKVDLTLDTGQSLDLTGDLGRMGDPVDDTITTKIVMYPADKMPAPARFRRQLKLTSVEMRLIAREGEEPLRRMIVATNGFTLDTSGVGRPPISVSGIARSPEGHLQLGEVALRIGPPEARYLELEGSVGNAQELKDLAFGATLSVPAASLLAPELFQDSDVLGTLKGGFKLNGDIKSLKLSDMTTQTEGTDLWKMSVNGSVGNTLYFDNVALDVSAEIPSGEALMEALSLKAIEAGKVALQVSVQSDAKDWKSKTKMSVDDSELTIALDLDATVENPSLNGSVTSDLIKMSDLEHIVGAGLQLKKLHTSEKLDESEKRDQVVEQAKADGLQPLVVPSPDDELVLAPLIVEKPKKESELKKIESKVKLLPLMVEKVVEGEKKLQPLIVDTASAGGPAEAEDDSDRIIRNVTLEPVVTSLLQSAASVDIDIDLQKIEGAGETDAIKTAFVIKDNKANIGPVKFAYGGGQFDVSGTMDLENSPELVSFSGSTGGWELAEILHKLDVGKSGSGVLYGSFEVSGRHQTVKDFVDSLSGNVTVTMKNGSIDTQLLDLAGLGILPWVFSSGKGKAAPIVCLRAPLVAKNGTVSTSQTVVETNEVQVVVDGSVNLAARTIDIRGEPRKLGHPLSRSPWPFDLVGSLNHPKVKVKDGPKREKRADGADKMPAQRKLCVPDILQLVK